MSESAKNAGQPNVPKLRFPGFTDPWEQRKLGEVAEFDKGVGFSKNDFADEGEPLFHYGRLYTDYACVVRYVDTFAVPQKGAVFSAGGEVVTPSSGETAEDIAVASAIVSPGIMLGSGLNIIRPCPELDPVFLALSISHGRQHCDLAKRAQGKSVVHLYNDDLAKSTLMTPRQIEEQRAIGRFFESIDSLITLRQRELDGTKKMKRGFLQKMFPREGADVPEIRFPGFTDPWEQRKLGELYSKNTERNVCGFGAERTLSAATMTFNEGGNGADESSLPSYKVVRVGDVAFEGHTNKEHAYGRFVVNTQEDGIMSPRFSCLRPKHHYSISFWKYYLHNEQVMRKILVRATKLGTMMNELVFDDLFSQTIFVPTEAEQRAIGAFFRDLDSLITLRQRELDHVKLLKKSLLQQMFV